MEDDGELSLFPTRPLFPSPTLSFRVGLCNGADAGGGVGDGKSRKGGKRSGRWGEGQIVFLIGVGKSRIENPIFPPAGVNADLNATEYAQFFGQKLCGVAMRTGTINNDRLLFQRMLVNKLNQILAVVWDIDRSGEMAYHILVYGTGID